MGAAEPVFVHVVVLAGHQHHQFGWQAIFWVNAPLGLLTFLLALRCLPLDRPGPQTAWASFDALGTLLLALTLTAYALAMTVGRGSVGSLNAALLLAATRVGLVMSTGPLVAALTGVPAGRLTDRFGAHTMSLVGLVASVMGAVFAFGAAATDITTASAQSVAVGMHVTFAVAAGLVVVGLAIALGSRLVPKRPWHPQGLN